MKTIVLLFFLFILTDNLCHAQRKCGYVDYMNYLYKRNPDLKRQHDAFNALLNQKLNQPSQFKINQAFAATQGETIYEIPVVVHVIHNVANNAITGNNISDAQILSQIPVLNQDYRRLNADTVNTYSAFKSVAADVKIQFCLATLDPNGNPTTGIVRVYNPQASFDITQDATIKGLSYWPNSQYLNIWVCSLANGYLGYGQFPDSSSLTGLSPYMGSDYTDGIVVDYQVFGTTGASTYPYNLGRTATHEIGHWLGLIHVWGDAYCGDDYVSDTPPQETYTSGATCSMDSSDCLGPKTLNMNQNYMDYSADACMNIFTQGQTARMRTVMQVSPKRIAVLNAFSCCQSASKLPIPYTVNFEDESYLSDGWKVINYDSSSTYSKQWERVSPGAYGQSNYSFMIENDSVYNSSVDSLYWNTFVSPYFNFSNTTYKSSLDFDLAYAYNATGSNNTDSLVVSYSIGCKGVWNVLDVIYGNELITSKRQVNNFVPNATEWNKVSIDLAFLMGQQNVKFRIADYSKGVNNLYIDNIHLFERTSELIFNLFPIPVKDILNVEVLYTGLKDVKIEAYNKLGEKVMTIENTNTPSFTMQVNVSGIESGLYIFRVTSGSNSVTQKVIIY
ncbi:MAG TPA: M43 family zinc metalloprotease [Cytophagaceae bacterium]|nr:M43 family zinc metalloprotease [Cytophagaceae bacterium]